ncbi:MAG: GNAT family N-acetyltransferase [Ewingella americana]|jgi:ribosomal protein S18 acetylase RimI-like enzyme|uniref:GNAT family N-acetyltransferase n=1 Tax=Ewingella americana TaxID=41202 RepID=UPI00242FB6F3|nr:GNAT family N-acetyltransferase [Ewingella americana]MCI1676596.1 GNAT family N-acetyltransferase [Ewingella americana]MCI1853814.1 GNAT family N-acetyltransferase [Ewingella americana]MCI1859945.1 GNAT family N-acetyltransferase [Ewingella americana]MCI2142273.1 GNAT family N-acetyltransferase [Ewingella americana]MCI2163236.1 GNAT family N-acetyltransferase [Ewingella americana]
MFKVIDFKNDRKLVDGIINMLRDDAKSPFDYLSEPLSSLLGLVTNPVVDRKLGTLINDDGIICGYVVFSFSEIHQFYVAPDYRNQRLGREMLSKLTQVFKLRGLSRVVVNVLHTEQARRFWVGNGALPEDANSHLYIILL